MVDLIEREKRRSWLDRVSVLHPWLVYVHENIQIHKNSFSVKLDDVAIAHQTTLSITLACSKKRWISGTAGRVFYTTVEQSSYGHRVAASCDLQ